MDGTYFVKPSRETRKRSARTRASERLAGRPGWRRMPDRLPACKESTTLAVATGPTGGSGPLTARLLISTDGGEEWTTAATDSQELGASARQHGSGSRALRSAAGLAIRTKSG